MISLPRFFSLALVSLCLLACSHEATPRHDAQPLTPITPKPIDPPDDLADLAVQEFLQENNAPAASRYELARIDLNDDGRREALILFKNPYGYWCGMHGCTMLVLRAYDDHFKLVNGVQPIRAPLYVGTAETNGWKDLIVRVSGRWQKSRDVALQFDGRRYPNNPSDLPPYLHYTAQDVSKIFQN